MRRFIVEIHDVEDVKAFAAVQRVIEQGRISQTRNTKHYCHHTGFGSGIEVDCVLNKKSQRFIVRSVKFDKFKNSVTLTP